MLRHVNLETHTDNDISRISEAKQAGEQPCIPTTLPLIHPSVYLEHSKPKKHLSLGAEVQGIKMLLLTGSEKGNT